MVLIVELALVVLFSIICSVYDVRAKSVPVWLLVTGPASIAIFKLIFERPFNGWWLITAGVAGLFYFIVRQVTRGKLGMADVLFGVFQGMVLSSPHLLLCILIECGSATLAFFIIHKHASGKSLPFIPFMAGGLLISYLISFCY